MIRLPDVDELVATAGDGAVLLTFGALATEVEGFTGTVRRVVRRATGGYPRALSDGDLVATDPQPFHHDVGLTNRQTYYYALFVEPVGGQNADVGYAASLGTFAKATPESGETDTEAPRITGGPYVTALSESSAVVAWTANEAALGSVRVEPAGTVVNDTVYATVGRVVLQGLAPSSASAVVVCLRDANANGPTCSEAAEISLGTAADDTAPVFVEYPSVLEVDETRAVFKTVTDDAVFVEVAIGETEAYGLTVARQGAPAAANLIEITGLSPNTNYNFKVTTRNAAGLSTTSDNQTFATCAGCSPTTGAEGDTVCDSRTTGTTAAVIGISSQRLARATISWGIGGAGLTNTAVTGSLERWQTRLISGLGQSETLNYSALLTDRYGNEGAPLTGSCATAQNAPSGTLRITEGPFADYGHVSPTMAVLEWQTDFIARSRVLDFGLAAPNADLGPAGALEGVALRRLQPPGNAMPYGLRHRASLTNLSPAMKYYVVVENYDLFDRVAVSEATVFSTPEWTDVAPLAFVEEPTLLVLSQDEAIWEWKTDRISISELFLRSVPTAGRDAQAYSWSSPEATSSHRAVISGVSSGRYAVSVQARTSGGDMANASPDQVTVDPQSPPDTTAPVISNVAAVPLSNGQGLLRWNTDEPATSVVKYGTSVPLRDRIDDRGLIRGHLLQLTGLQEGAKIIYEISATDAVGNTSSHDLGNLQLQETRDLEPPVIDKNSAHVSWINPQTALVEWDTDEPSNSAVEYGGGMQYALLAQDGQHVTHHEVTLGGLFGGKTYFARVFSIDAEGNKSNRLDVDAFTPPVPLGGKVGYAIVIVVLSVLLAVGVGRGRKGGRWRR
ncbi:MAG: fibronectin type III domain-containing protein [Candidatus Schekmanbacteria bacterium]|nr:fibronectin type III domain-containing protein [Candidatus Schekmanbacteria bacterium]